MAQMVASPEPFNNGNGAAGSSRANADEPQADPGGPGDPGCPPDVPPGDPRCPIDGGVVFLIAAGVGLAGKRAYKQKKESKTASQ